MDIKNKTINQKKKILLSLLISFSACNSFAGEFTSTDIGAKYVIMADPQAWRMGQGAGYPDPNSSGTAGKWVNFNQMVARGINAKADELKARFGIINGDITEFGRDAQLASFNKAYGGLKIPLYLGYGNHDYQKNVRDCTRWEDFDFDSNACAYYMLKYMVSLTNNYKSKLNNFSLDYSRKNESLDIGSYSYSWDDFSPESGTSHFVQLQLAPTYKEKFYYYAFPAESRHIEINDSIAWLTHDLEMARKRGVRNIFINFHALELVKNGTAWQKSALKALFNEYKIAAVFVGHTHNPNQEKYQEVFGNVPIYTTGALYSGYFDILKVTWDGFQVQSYQVKDNNVVMVQERSPVARPKAPLTCFKPDDNIQRGDIVKSKLIQNAQQVFMLRQVKTSNALDANSNGDVYTNKAANNNPYMRWRMEYLSTNAFGQVFYKVIHNKYGKVLDGNRAGDIYTKKWNGGPYQQWEVLEYDGSGIVQLRNRATGRLLDATKAGTVSGAATTLSHNNNYQKWNITDRSGNSIDNVRYFKAKSDGSRGKPLPKGNTSNAWWEYMGERSRTSAAPCVDKIDDGLSQFTKVAMVNEIDLSARAIADALQKEASVVIHSIDGRWSQNINLPTPDVFKGKMIFIKHDASYHSTIKADRGNVTTVTKGQRLVYISNGKEWLMQDI